MCTFYRIYESTIKNENGRIYTDLSWEHYNIEELKRTER